MKTDALEYLVVTLITVYTSPGPHPENTYKKFHSAGLTVCGGTWEHKGGKRVTLSLYNGRLCCHGTLICVRVDIVCE